MAGFRTPEVPRHQAVLWSQRLDDALPLDHVVRHLADLLESETFRATFQQWAGEYVLLEGQPPYHPRDLTALYIYGMLNRLRSSRQLEAACWNRVDVIWLMSGQHPDHSTIAEFVKQHGGYLRQVFRDTVRAGVQAGLVKLEHVSVDGTKIEADAGQGSVHREATLVSAVAALDEQIAALEQEWSANEAREQSLFGPEAPWCPASSGSMKSRLERMQAQQKRLREALDAIVRRREENAGGPAPRAIASVTDPASRVMPDKEGKSKPNYNGQIGVDATAGVIVAGDVNDRAEDSGQMTPLLGQIAQNAGDLPKEASADSQYNTGPELEALERMGVTGFLPDSGEREAPALSTPAAQAVAAAQAGAVLSAEQWQALPKDGQGRVTKQAFRYAAESDTYVCPMGQVLSFIRNSQERKNWGLAIRAQYGNGSACARCPRALMCCRNPKQGRTVNRDQYEDCRQRMSGRMKTETGRRGYRLRRQTVEPRFGYIKRGLGVRRFLHRGLEAVRTEWSLVCTAVNAGILLRHRLAVLTMA